MRVASRLVVLLGACCILWGACGKPRGRGYSAPVPIRAVHLTRAELRPMERTIPVSGTLAPQEKSTLSAKVSGRVQELAVDIGSVVRRGDLIAQVEPQDYELRLQQSVAALAQARAAVGLPLEGDDDQLQPDAISSVKQAKAVLEEATRSLERTRSLTQSRIASAAELDTVEAAYKVALTKWQAAVEDGHARLAALAQRRAEHELAKKQLKDASILAPFDGTVQSRPAAVGEYVLPGDPIVTLVKLDPLRLRLEVPERESGLLRLNQEVRLRVEADTNYYYGRVSRISPALDETNRMLLVEADVPNSGALRGGLFARAEIVVQQHEPGLSVPSAALITFAGIEKVLIVRDGKAQERPVTTGRRGSGWVEILSGIGPDTAVVLEPGGLRSGQPVAIGSNERAEAGEAPDRSRSLSAQP